MPERLRALVGVLVFFVALAWTIGGLAVALSVNDLGDRVLISAATLVVSAMLYPAILALLGDYAKTTTSA